MYQPISLKTKSPSLRNSISRSLVAIITLLLAAIANVQSAHAATITVNSTADPTESGKTTLRDALAAASDGDTIDFSVTTPATIALTSGELVVGKSVTISGPGADQLSVNGNAASRLFHISSGKTVTISGLTITNGSATGGFPAGTGGGIYNDHATLTINNCTLSGNSASFGGGGINNDGTSAAFFGSATLTINKSTLSGNSSSLGGGGIFNSAEAGSATLTINSSTLSGNSAPGSLGGGIFNDGRNSGSATLTLSNSTLSGNSASSAGGIDNEGNGGSATLTVGDTILNAGDSGENIFNDSGIVISLGYNISSDNGGGFLTATGDQINTDPLLGPLQNNGGSTLTHLPSSNSPAIGAGDPLIDQRGPGFGPPVTVGAVQVQPTPSPHPTPPPHPTPHPH